MTALQELGREPSLAQYTSVRFVKNGAGGKWWPTAKATGQVHLGWSNVPHDLLQNPDFLKIERINRTSFSDDGSATRDFNALWCLLDGPSQHLWITFEDDCMWWCTVQDGARINPNGEDRDKGHFHLSCDRVWSNHSLSGRLLAMTDLPGTVNTVAGFRGTVCEPRASQVILRIIRDEPDNDVANSRIAGKDYQHAVKTIVSRLHPKDFEQLIDLILARTGWVRLASLGGTREGIDVEVENVALNEIAFVQVKSSAAQPVLDDYVKRFNARRSRYARMIFAVHTAPRELTPPADPAVQVWTGAKVAELVVHLGLVEWVENKL